MKRKIISGSLILIIFIQMLLISCASIATKSKLYNQELIYNIDKVAVWPPLVDYPWEEHDKFVFERKLKGVSSYSSIVDSANNLTKETLVDELKKLNMLEIILPDSLNDLIMQHNGKNIFTFRKNLKPVRQLPEIKSVLITKLRLQYDYMDGFNTYITMSLVSVENFKSILEVTFNTRLGKIYIFPPGPKKTIPDGIKGAIKGLVNSLKKNR